jgi:hypothetical protein
VCVKSLPTLSPLITSETSDGLTMKVGMDRMPLNGKPSLYPNQENANSKQNE